MRIKIYTPLIKFLSKFVRCLSLRTNFHFSHVVNWRYPVRILTYFLFLLISQEAHSDRVEKSIATLEDLGIHLTRMEDQVPWELRTFRAHTYSEKELMEFETPNPPQTIPV